MAVDPTIAKQLAVIEQELEKNDGRGQDEPRKDLHANDDQLQRHMRDEHNRRRRADARHIRA